MAEINGIKIDGLDRSTFINKDSENKVLFRLSDKLNKLDMFVMAYFGQRIKEIKLEDLFVRKKKEDETF
jgi:hypothetical protein